MNDSQVQRPGTGLPVMRYRCRNDGQGTLERASSAVLPIAGATPDDLAGGRIGWEALVHPDDRTRRRAVLEAAAATGEPFQVEYRIRRLDGAELWVLEQGEAVFGGGVEPVAFEGFLSDISEHKRTEDSLRESETRYRTLMSVLPAAAYTCDAEGRIDFFNERAATFWGRRPELGDPDQRFCGSYALYTPDGEPMPYERTPMARAVQEGTSCRNAEVVIEHPDGRRLFVLVNVEPLRDGQGRIRGAVNAFVDITERRGAEDSLADARRRLLAALTGGEIATWVWDLDNERIYTDRNMAAFFKMRDDGSGLPAAAYAETVHPEDRARVLALLKGALRSGEDFVAEYRLAGFDPPRWVYARAGVERDAEDRAGRLAGVLMDISERKRAEESLRESESRFRSVFANAAIGFAMTTAEGRFVDVNPAYCTITGYGLEELQLLSFPHLLHPEDRADTMHRIERTIKGEIPDFVVESRYLRKDRSAVWVRKSVSLVRNRSGVPLWIVALVEDITERKSAEEALQRSESRFRQLADAMPQLVWTADTDGAVDYYNRRAAEYAGLERGADGAWSWRPVLEPEDLEATTAAWRRAVETGDPYQCEHRVRLADGSPRWHLSRAVPARDETGRVVKWFGTATDIQDIKLAQHTLQEADRRKDEFLATLAHELRNPLAPIRNAVEVLKLQVPQEPRLMRALEMIDRQVAHLVRLIDDLLDVSRITRGKLRLRREYVELSSVLQQALETVRAQVGRNGPEIAVALPPEPVYLDADPVRLSQILLNLLNNACRYTNRDGSVRVSAERTSAEVVVRIADTGIGIAPEHLPQLFRMFAQVGAAAEQSQGGLGIGLALTRGLVEMHGGTIEAYSAGLGKGTELVVRLPLLAGGAPAPPAEGAARPQEPSGRSEAGRPRRVLLADDNPDVADSLGLLLALSGFEVETARDGEQAVAAALRSRPDAVLLDLGMPKLDGYAACRRIREEPWAKNLKILALTGWGQEGDRRKSADAGFDGHLVKPVEPELLIRLLGGHRGS